MTHWPELKALINAGDIPGIVRVGRGLSAEERRSLAEPLSAHERWLRGDDGLLARLPHGYWRAMQAALVACAIGLPPAKLAVVLVRHGLAPEHNDPTDSVAAVLEVLRTRDPSWLADLATRLAERLPAGTRVGWAPGAWRLAAALTAVTGMDPPLTDGFVSGFVGRSWDDRSDPDLAAAIRQDRRLAALVPRMFEVDDIRIPSLALLTLAQEGVLERPILIDGSLGRLERGGRRWYLEQVVRLLDGLAPSLDEVAQRVPDYVALLSGTHVMAAELGQRELRRLDDACALDQGLLSEISETVLYRREHKLVRAQLDWLDTVARRDPVRSAEVLRAVAAAFVQESADLQRRALTVARRHAPHADAATHAELAQAALSLRPQLRERAAATFGRPAGAVASEADDEPRRAARPVPPLPAEPLALPERLPAPIGSPAELADELSWPEVTFDPVWVERVLAALVTFSSQDRAGLRGALRGALRGVSHRFCGWAGFHSVWAGHPDWAIREAALLRVSAAAQLADYLCETTELWSVIGSAATAPDRFGGGEFPALVPGESTWQRAFAESQPAGPQRILLRRLHEISVGISYAPRPLLMAAPTSPNGLLDPGVLLARIERAADEGWEPWELDLEQALLRLPPDVDPGIGARARQLGTSAAGRLAAWLDGGGTPGLEVTPAPRSDAWPATVAAVAPVRPRGPGPCLLSELELAEPERRPRFARKAEVWDDYRSAAWFPCWPAMLPAHRDVIAAHLVPLFAREIASGERRPRGVAAAYGSMRVLSLLAHADGPAGPGLNLALGYGLTGRDQAGREAAVRALLVLIGRGQFDGTAFGREFGALAASEELLLGGVVTGLRQARQAGAAGPVWDLIAAALPALLPPAVARAPHHLSELIELGADIAEDLRPAGPVPAGLAEVAARSGAARYVQEARRLLKALSPG
jgi:hypothetical protein